MIPRISLFEFNDQPWYPKRFRGYLTDILGFFISKKNLYDPVNNLVKNTLQQLNCHEIVDLCSGSGEPALQLRESLINDIPEIKLILTDKFPDQKKIKEFSKYGASIQYKDQSIDATNFPKDLKGFRTLFSSFHHFNPQKAKQILQDAVNNEAPIGIFEFTERTWVGLFFTVFATIQALIITPFIKPFSIQRLFWTYILPIFPVTLLWDGLVSNLRSYHHHELKKLSSDLTNNTYHWASGKLTHKDGLNTVVYLIGYPDNT